MSALRTMRLIQFTDTHLYGVAEERLKGVDTLATLQTVLAHARSRHWPADGCIVSGDIAHDGSAAAYARLRRLLVPLGVPVYCLPGNHDLPAVMRTALATDNVSCPDSIVLGAWQLIFVDSTVPGQDGGHLSEAARTMLHEQLSAYRDRYALVVIHHPPVAVGSSWIDEMAVDNPEALFDTLAGHPQLRGVLCGHVHQDFTTSVNGVPVFTTPSTCVQFKPGVSRLEIDNAPPGYRWVELTPEGMLRTGVERVDPAELVGRHAS